MSKSLDPDRGLEVIKLEFILKLKIKRNDWLLVTLSLYQQMTKVAASKERIKVTKFETCAKLHVFHILYISCHVNFSKIELSHAF